MDTLFLDNKYTKWYWTIVTNAKDRVWSPDNYQEQHHIIPRSLGGTNEKTNLVYLSAREHFVCHVLLTKMTTGIYKTKMHFAAKMLLDVKRDLNKRYKPNSRLFATIREQYAIVSSESQRGRVFSNETKIKMSVSQKANMLNGKNPLSKINSETRSETHSANIANSKKGKPWSWVQNPETRKRIGLKISKALTGKSFSDEHRKNISKSHIGIPNAMKGKKYTEQQCANMRKPKTNTTNMKGPKNKKTCTYCGLTGSSRNITTYHLNNCFLSAGKYPEVKINNSISLDREFTINEISRELNISSALILYFLKIAALEYRKDRARIKIQYQNLIDTLIRFKPK